MNFFQFLKNNNNSQNQITLDNKSKNEVLSVKTYHSTILKPGDRIKIIYYPNSYYNSYKGYYGEIKEYKKSQPFALVHIYTSTSTRKISLPIEHFVKINE